MEKSFFTKIPYSYDYGTFIERPNRFIAHVMYKGKSLRCHVPDPGRLKDLLITERKVLLRFSPTQKEQKTDASVIGVFLPEGNIWVSLDSQLANRFIKHSWKKLEAFKSFEEMKPEYTFGNSRLDFLFTNPEIRTLVEVKTVTLVEDGIGKFPDAPTKRGARHVLELIEAKKKGFDASVTFVVPRKDVKLVQPHKKLDKKFYQATQFAYESGVKFIVLLCDFTPNGISFIKEIPFTLH